MCLRREGLAGNFICGRSPSEDEEPPVKDLNVDYNYFEEQVWPMLARRCPAFESLKVFMNLKLLKRGLLKNFLTVEIFLGGIL